MLFVIMSIFGLSQAHNWIHSRSRAIKASTLQPAPSRPSSFTPHIRVGKNQEFGFEWATGHKNSEYFFVVLKATHEDKLHEHTISNLKAYISQAPASAHIQGSKWQKRHVSCGFSNMCNPKYQNTGKQYVKQLHKGDPLYFDRPRAWGNEGVAQFQYKSNDLQGDVRVSYTNKHWPWIEAVHKFTVSGHAYPREWDVAPFKIEGKQGTGHYLIHMVWRGYRDVIDVDLLASNSPDIYGSPGNGGSAFSKINHCQFKTYDHKNNKCFFVDKTTRDISKCLANCKKNRRKCSAVNVVPLVNPDQVKFDNVNVPWASTNCNQNLASKFSHKSTLVCYGMKPKYSKAANKDVDAPWTVIPDDPEDPIFYSTCYNLQSNWVFQGFNGKSKPQATPIIYKVANLCLSCDAVDGISKLPYYHVPRWKLSHECSKCA